MTPALLLEAALEYASHGWRVFPVRGKNPRIPKDHPLKEPGTKWGQTCDPDRLRGYFEAFDGITGIALACGPESGWEVLDIDGEQGWEACEALGWTRETFERVGVPLVRSGRDGEGFHAYFHPDPGARATSLKFPKLKLDYKGAGRGYVVLPPSKHPDTGRAYAWATMRPWEPPCVPQHFPEELLEPVTLSKLAWVDSEKRTHRLFESETGTLADLEEARERAAIMGTEALQQQESARPTQATTQPSAQTATQRGLSFNRGGDPLARARGALRTACEEVRSLVDGRRQAIHDKAHALAGWDELQQLGEEEVTGALLAAAGPGDSTPEARARAAHDGWASGTARPRGPLPQRPLAPQRKQEQQHGLEQEPEEPKPIPFLTVEQMRAKAQERPREWFMKERALPFGAVLQIIGPPKVSGKSTLVWAMIGAAERGEDFLGEVLPRTKAVILTEESDQHILAKLDRFGVKEARILPRSLGRDAVMEDAVAEARRVARETGARLLVVDTMAHWAKEPGDGEAKASYALRLRCLQEAADEEGMLAVFIHHTKKATEGSLDIYAGRNTSAVPGAVEASWFLKPASNRESRERVLAMDTRDGLGEVTIEQVGEPHECPRYILKGNTREVEQDSVEDAVLAWLAAHQGWHRKDDLSAALGGKRDEAQKALPRLARLGQVDRDGAGKPGDPFVYAALGTPKRTSTSQERIVWSSILEEKRPQTTLAELLSQDPEPKWEEFKRRREAERLEEERRLAEEKQRKEGRA